MWPFNIRKKRREARERQASIKREAFRQRLLQLIEKVEARNITQDEIREFRSISDNVLAKGEWLRWSDACDIIYAIERMDRDGKSVQHALDWLKDAENLDQQVFRLADLLSKYNKDVDGLNAPLLEKEFGHDRKKLLTRLKRLTKKRYQELLGERTKGAKQLEDLGIFIRETHSRRNMNGRWEPNRLKAVSVEPLPYPEDWNELVALFYPTPTPDQFIDLAMNSGNVLLLAEEAGRMANAKEAFVNAQIVLAYCRAEANYRIHVGDILVTRMAEIVNAYRESQSATAAGKGVADVAE